MIVDAIHKIDLGRLGENDARIIRFNLSDFSDYPNASFVLLNMRPTDAVAYPVSSVVHEGNYLLWTVKSGDLAHAGDGKCEIVAYENDVIVKSVIFETTVRKALDSSENPPSPWESWVQEVLEASEDAQEAAQDAQEAAQEITSMTATAETLEPGSSATASYSDGVLTLGIPSGTPGMESVLVGTQISGNKYQLGIERV